MVYVKFNYKGAWYYYGPWKNVGVHYNCKRIDAPGEATQLQVNDQQFIPEEIFSQEDVGIAEYTVIDGWEDGRYCTIAFCGCKAYLLTLDGKTLERI